MIGLFSSLLHLFYPHTCEGCGTALTRTEEILCLRCQLRLPATHFQHFRNNPVEKIFWGRVNIKYAMAAYYYRKSSLLQRLIHQFKYHDRQDIALHMGRQTGHQLLQSNWIYEINGIVPVPMHRTRERQRGYNQAQLLATGIAAVVNKPLLPELLVRQAHTNSQTRKNRLLRWQNVSEVFSSPSHTGVHHPHILLVDDVITTGATAEACGEALQRAGMSVSICCLAYAHH
jgi:ComF family protein